jgi:hypothetical protein
MPYPKSPKGEDYNADSRATAPTAPGTARVVAPQVTGARGGAPQVNKNSLGYMWKGQQTTAGGRLPVPSTMPLAQAQTELATFAQRTKANLDARMASLPPAQVARSRFWRVYQQYPEQMATLSARRVWTDQMVGRGNVADWMNFIGGGK